MKILFMGTPDFAVGILDAIVNGDVGEVVGAVTQPDKPKGRSSVLIPSPVKEYALSHGIKVYQPAKIKASEEVEILRGIDADIYVVAAFGQILSKEILDIPRYGCINVHASLLPQYRGAAPIQWSIYDGKEYTGVTIQQMKACLRNFGMQGQSLLSILFKVLGIIPHNLCLRTNQKPRMPEY